MLACLVLVLGSFGLDEMEVMIFGSKNAVARSTNVGHMLREWRLN
jgi:hypothetical protein